MHERFPYDPELVRLSNLLKLKADLNPKRHDLPEIKKAIRRFGFLDPVRLDERTQKLVKGHGRLDALFQMKLEGEAPPRYILLAPDGDWLVPVLRGHQFNSDHEAQAYLLADNRTSERGGWDYPDLAQSLQMVRDGSPEGLEGTGFTDEDEAALCAEIAAAEQEAAQATEEVEKEDLDLEMPEAEDAPDIIWESDNEWGIPTLDLSMQAENIQMPMIKWGSIGRKTQIETGYHFYTDDYKFTGLWGDPHILVRSGARYAVEPNVSTGPRFPRAVALMGVYQKRWIARYWQSKGVRVLVDMNVEHQFADLNLLGIPEGWRAYCTRAYTRDQNAEIPYSYEIACQRAGTDQLLFVVYGGGQATRTLCQQRGWIWHPEHNDKVRGRA